MTKNKSKHIVLNNILYRHLNTFTFPKRMRKKVTSVKTIVRNFSTTSPTDIIPVSRSSAKTLVERLRSFKIREDKGLTALHHKRLNILISNVDDLQSLQDQPKQESNEDLLKQIKALEMRVKANSVFPSGHALSLATKIAFNNLLEALDDVIQAPSAEVSMILSQDRIRILTSDLVYLSKREHLFHVPKLT